MSQPESPAYLRLKAAAKKANEAAVAHAVLALKRVYDLHRPTPWGSFTICTHCSQWDEMHQRPIGLLIEHPCDTVRALDLPTIPGETT
jgi:hypothetical protein